MNASPHAPSHEGLLGHSPTRVTGNPLMNYNSRIFVAGHNGMVGSAIFRRLTRENYSNILATPRQMVDLRDKRATSEFFRHARPEFVFLCAATVGGIFANIARPADFIYDNLAIQLNVIEACREYGVRRLMFLGSSCIYPVDSWPSRESDMGCGPVEPTNSAYAMAKLAGVEMLRAYRKQHGLDSVTVMPCNLYGPGDCYDPARSHVLAAMIDRLHTAKITGDDSVTFRGTGEPTREFLYVDDLADAMLLLMNHERPLPVVNVGTGLDWPLLNVAQFVADAVGYRGEIRFDGNASRNGVARKVMNVELMREEFKWSWSTPLERGIPLAYQDYLQRLQAQERQQEIEVRG